MSTGESGRRVALITGAGRGIGAAIAHHLAAQGVAVGVIDLDAEPAEATAAAIERAGGAALALAGDVANADACAGWAQAAADRFGGLDILVNNAGLTRDAMIHRMDRATWDVVQNVVLGGAFNMIQAVAPWFRDRERSRSRRIVNVSSVSGIYGSPGNANYSSAKAGLIGLTKSIAAEWARFGVTVNAVAPGFIDTRMTAARDESRRPRDVARGPRVDRLPDPGGPRGHGGRRRRRGRLLLLGGRGLRDRPGARDPRRDAGHHRHRLRVTATATPPHADRASYRLVLTILFASGLIYTVLVTLVVPAVHVLAAGIHGSDADATWILTTFVLSGSVATPIIGRLGDMYGRKRALVVVLWSSSPVWCCAVSRRPLSR